MVTCIASSQARITMPATIAMTPTITLVFKEHLLSEIQGIITEVLILVNYDLGPIQFGNYAVILC